MTLRDSMRRHPAGKTLPRQRARLVRSVAKESALMGTAGLVGSLTVITFAGVAYLASDLPVVLRVLMLVPIAVLPLLALQAVHGLTDAVRLLKWGRHYVRQAKATQATTNKQRRTK